MTNLDSLTTAAVADLRELLEKATPGEWKCWDAWGPHTDGDVRVKRLGPVGGRGITESLGSGDIKGRAEDFELICHLRNAAAPLLRMAEEHARMRAALLEYGEHFDDCKINDRDGVPCSCGLLDAIAALAAGEPRGS